LYDEEDLDLVQGAIAIASTEIQRAQGHLAEWTAIGGMRTQEIQAALSEAVGYAQEVKARSSYTMQVMQEYTAKIQNLKRQYEEALHEIAVTSETHVTTERIDIVENKRFYELPNHAIKILDIRCKDHNNYNGEYRSIPRSIYESVVKDSDGV